MHGLRRRHERTQVLELYMDDYAVYRDIGQLNAHHHLNRRVGDIAVSPSEEPKTPRANEQTRKHQRHKHADFQEKAPLRVQPLILVMESLALGPIPAEQCKLFLVRELVIHLVYELEVCKSRDQATNRDTRERNNSDYDAS